MRTGMTDNNSSHISVDVSGTAILTLLTLCRLVPLALRAAMHWPLALDMLLACVVPLMRLLRRVEINQELRGASPRLHSHGFQVHALAY
jgi:hypothetical protein